MAMLRCNKRKRDAATQTEPAQGETSQGETTQHHADAPAQCGNTCYLCGHNSCDFAVGHRGCLHHCRACHRRHVQCVRGMTREAMDPSSNMGPSTRSLVLDMACCHGDCTFPRSAVCSQCEEHFCQTCAPPRVPRGMCQICFDRNQRSAASSSSSHDDVDHSATLFMQTDVSIEADASHHTAGSSSHQTAASSSHHTADASHHTRLMQATTQLAHEADACHHTRPMQATTPSPAANHAANASHHTAGGSSHQTAGETSNLTTCTTHQAAGDANNNAAARRVILRVRVQCETCEYMFPEDEVWYVDGEPFCMPCLDQQQPQQPDTAIDESDVTWLMQQGTKRRRGQDADTPMDDSASGADTRMVAGTSGHSQGPSNWATAMQAQWLAAGASGCFVCCVCQGIHPFVIEEGPACVDFKGRPCKCHMCGQAVCAACSADHQCAQPSEASSGDNAGPSPTQHVRIGPNGEVLTPRGHKVHDTNSFGRPPTFGGGDSWRFNDDDHMSMLSMPTTDLLKIPSLQLASRSLHSVSTALPHEVLVCDCQQEIARSMREADECSKFSILQGVANDTKPQIHEGRDYMTVEANEVKQAKANASMFGVLPGHQFSLLRSLELMASNRGSFLCTTFLTPLCSRFRWIFILCQVLLFTTSTSPSHVTQS